MVAYTFCNYVRFTKKTTEKNRQIIGKLMFLESYSVSIALRK